MDQRIIIVALAVLAVLGIIWYASQTPPAKLSAPPVPPPATTPTTPPAP